MDLCLFPNLIYHVTMVKMVRTGKLNKLSVKPSLHALPGTTPTQGVGSDGDVATIGTQTTKKPWRKKLLTLPILYGKKRKGF